MYSFILYTFINDKSIQNKYARSFLAKSGKSPSLGNEWHKLDLTSVFVFSKTLAGLVQLIPQMNGSSFG